MSLPDAELLYRLVPANVAARIEKLEVFAEIDSTNTYLMSAPVPPAGKLRVAVTDNQTAGRGRRDRRWHSPPGTGLCMSLAYTFENRPGELSALTLAIGIGTIEALRKMDISGVSLKWPNDLVLENAKLGGILTELRQGGSGLTVVTGIGINVDLKEPLDIREGSEWTTRAIDLRAAGTRLPMREAVAARIIESLCGVFGEFDASGIEPFLSRWETVDWLHGREIVIETDGKRLQGVAAGIDGDGALILDTNTGSERIISGSISLLRPPGGTA